jgi:predicted 3-demethylubiquinone-9 3-methyltransferase (glyoxalase superfamily)
MNMNLRKKLGFSSAELFRAHEQPGSAKTVEFQRAGQNFVVFNGGPHFCFTEAISCAANCISQEELDCTR